MNLCNILLTTLILQKLTYWNLHEAHESWQYLHTMSENTIKKFTPLDSWDSCWIPEIAREYNWVHKIPVPLVPFVPVIPLFVRGSLQLLLLYDGLQRRREMTSPPVTWISLHRQSYRLRSSHSILLKEIVAPGHKPGRTGFHKLIRRLRPELLESQQTISRVTNPLTSATAITTADPLR
jgi:hypothetical protein